jgi:hypothetical protein
MLMITGEGKPALARNQKAFHFHAVGKWAAQQPYISMETLGTVSDTAPVSLPAVAA